MSVSPIWQFPKIRGIFLGVLIIRTITFRGLMWGPPIWRNFHIFLHEKCCINIVLSQFSSPRPCGCEAPVPDFLRLRRGETAFCDVGSFEVARAWKFLEEAIRGLAAEVYGV